MTTTHAGMVAVGLVIAWGIVMLMLLRWAQDNAAMQAARRKAEQEDAAERARADAYWASPEGRQRKAQMDAEQRWYERQVSATATKPASQWSVAELDSWWRRVEPVRPTFAPTPAPVQPQPVYVAPPAYNLPRPVVQPKPAPVPVQSPGILVPNWPTPERVHKAAQQ